MACFDFALEKSSSKLFLKKSFPKHSFVWYEIFTYVKTALEYNERVFIHHRPNHEPSQLGNAAF